MVGSMNCEEVRELLPAYASGILEESEMRAVEEHLRGGSEHDEELMELRASLFALDRFADEEVIEAAIMVPSPPTHARLTAGPSWPGRKLRALSAWRALAAAVALAVVFGSGWLLHEFTLGEPNREVFYYLLEGAEGKVVSLSGVTGAETVTVTMTGIERLSSDHVYQVWAVRDGRWLSIGICNTSPEGRWVGDFTFAMRSDEWIALTIERIGGSLVPTSEPIIQSSAVRSR